MLILPKFGYFKPRTVAEACSLLHQYKGEAKVLAGGTDLLLDLQQGRHASVDTLVDITTVPELLTIELRSDQLFIGAAVPLAQIVESILVKKHAQALIEACSLIGGPQVRELATLGGNVAHALQPRMAQSRC